MTQGPSWGSTRRTGYTGPGGKTILPHRTLAKLDLRLVPDMTAQGTLESLKAHLVSHRFGEVEVRGFPLFSLLNKSDIRPSVLPFPWLPHPVPRL